MTPKLTKIREVAEQTANQTEAKAIEAALREHAGNLQAVATALECSRGYLYRAVAKYDLDLEAYRPDKGGAKPRANNRRRPSSDAPPNLLIEAVDDFERKFIEKHLKKHGGSIRAAALALGTSRGGLYKRMERLGVEFDSFR